MVALGHSAGGQPALWLTTRRTLPATSALRTSCVPLALSGVVSIGGIADLREFYARERSTCGNRAVESLLGGVPDSVPDRVSEASPIERIPLGIPSVHIAGSRDFIAPTAVREVFAEAARQRGDRATVTTIPDEGHFEAMTPGKAAGQAVIAAVRQFLRQSRN